MFASALVKEPRLLLLDAPFTGLDVATRPYFRQLINGLALSGITIIMATTEHEIPACVTHVARLESGILTGTWDREEFEGYRVAARVNDQQNMPLTTDRWLASLFQGPDPVVFALEIRIM